MGSASPPEATIVADLEAVLSRFQGDARAAFALADDADPPAVRAAFMTLCKRYHPAKYARFSPNVVRLANEAFLAIRRAHDELMRATAARGVGRAAAPPRTARTPPTGVPVVPVRAASVPTPMATAARASATDAAPSLSAERRSPTTLPQGVPVAASVPLPSPAVVTPPKPRAVTAAASPPPVRGPSQRPALEPPPAVDTRFDTALDHLRARRWAEARTILTALAAAAPAESRYRAYLHYLRGWEAYELGKDGEARAEWRRALSIDPGLGMATWALQQTNLG